MSQNYRPFPLERPLPLRGLVIEQPEGHPEVAVVRGLSPANYRMGKRHGYRMRLDPVLDELAQRGVRNLVVDFSGLPRPNRINVVLHLTGYAERRGFERQYTGFSAAELAGVEPYVANYIVPRIASSVDEAVARLAGI